MIEFCTNNYSFIQRKKIIMKKISLLFSAISLFLISCDKAITTPPSTTPTNNNTAAQTPSFPNGDGFLVALKSITKTTVAGFEVSTELGTGVAGFGDLASGTYNDAGAITLNSKSLTQNSNNTYSYIPGATDITGIDFGSSINWNIAGAGSVPAFTHNAQSQGFPIANAISGSFTTINSASDFTLSTTGSISNSDSVYFQVAGPNGVSLKRRAANTSSVTFSAAEIQALGKGFGSVVIAPWNWSTQTISGKTIHVVNETALSRVIEIQ
jgi:hypothetical protein